jgi:gentisate 1,2-dioxygenase
MELEQCDVIEHLIDFTETAAVDPAILEAAGASPNSTEAAAADRRGERRHKVVKETKLRNMSHPNNSLYAALNLMIPIESFFCVCVLLNFSV